MQPRYVPSRNTACTLLSHELRLCSRHDIHPALEPYSLANKIMALYLLLATISTLVFAQCEAQLLGTTSVWPATCSTTRSAIYYTSGASTYTVASCAPSTSYITLEATCALITPSAAPNASYVPTTVYISSPGQTTCPTMSATSTVYTNHPSALPPCNGTAGVSGQCLDAYSNPFDVAYGVQYSGDVVRSLPASDIDTSLTYCDESTSCMAVDLVNGMCSLLSYVSGTKPGAGGKVKRQNSEAMSTVAAARPAGVATVYTASGPASQTTGMPSAFNSTAVTQTSKYNGRY